MMLSARRVAPLPTCVGRGPTVRAHKTARRLKKALHAILALCSVATASDAFAISDLQLLLSHDHNPVSVSGSYEYIIEVKNSGTPLSPGTLVTVDLDLPDDVSVLGVPQSEGWTCGLVFQTPGLARCQRTNFGGVAYFLNWKVQAPPSIPITTGNLITATATVSPGGFPSDNDTFSENTKIQDTDLALEKSSDVDTVKVGAPFQYALQVTNSSGTSDTSRSSVIDQLPPGVIMLHAWGMGWACSQAAQQVTCQQSWDASVPAGSLNPPQPGVSPFAYIEVLAPPVAGTILNTATVNSPADSTPNNNGAQKSVVVQTSPDATDLELTNTATGFATVKEGSPYGYVLTVKNNGPMAESGAIMLHAVVPDPMIVVDLVAGAGWDCSWAPRDGVPESLVTCMLAPGLAAGATAPATTINVLAGLPGTDRVRAWVTGTADTNPANNMKDATKTVVATGAPDLAITKTAIPAYPTPIGRGATYSYALNVSVSGPSSGTTIVTDVLPDDVGFISATGSGWACIQTAGTVKCSRIAGFSGAAPVITITTTAPMQLPLDPIINRAVVTSTAGDPKTSNNVAEARIALANTNPVAVDDAYAVSPNQTLTVLVAEGVLLNDNDNETDPLAAIAGTQPVHGQLIGFNADGSFAYVPDPGFEGTDTFTYQVTDPELTSNFATVTIIVANQAPVADSQMVATPKNTSKFIVLTASDEENDDLTFAVVDAPDHGGQLAGTPPHLTYSPAPGFEGTEKFTFRASDDALDSNLATVTITVAGGAGNQAPQIDPMFQFLATPKDVPIPLTLTAVDPDGDALTFSIVNPPNQGGQLLGVAPNLTYVPAPGFNGIETLTYQASDWVPNFSSIATVTITVGDGGPGNQPPVANSQILITGQNTPKPITLTAIDPEGAFLNFEIVVDPAVGQLTGTPPNVTYIPPANFNGTAMFLFRARDGGFDSNVASVTITVGDGGPGNQAPVAHAQALVTPKNLPKSIALTATDPEAAVMTYALAGAPTRGGQVTGTPPNLTYTPPAGFVGIEMFTFNANDGTHDSNTATVSITVSDPGGQNQPPVISAQSFSVAEDKPAGTVVGTVVATDDGLPQPSLSYSIIAGNVGNAFTIHPTTGAISVTNALDYETLSSYALSVQVSDGALTTAATVTITVTDVANGPGVENTPPVIAAQAFSVAEDKPIGFVVGTVSATDDGLPQPPTLTYAITAGNTGNAFAIHPSTGVLTVNGALDYEALATYVLSVQVSDGALSSSAAATITITDVINGPGLENTAPVMSNSAFSAPEDRPAGSVVGTMTATDDGLPQPPTLTYAITAGNVGNAFAIHPSTGVITVNAPLDYEARPAYALSIQVSDGALSSTATATITITDVVNGPGLENTAPVISDQQFSVAEGVAVGFPVGAVAATDDGLPLPAALTYSITAGNTGNAFAISASTGTITVAAELDYETLSSYALSILVSDGLLSSTATATITVTDVIGGPGEDNLPPIVVDDAMQVAPGGTSSTLVGGATTVLANDSDPEGGSLTTQQRSEPEFGTLTLHADGAFSYTNTDPSATLDEFNYEACDDRDECSAGVVKITIGNGPINLLPVALPDAIEVAPGGAVNVLVSGEQSVLANDIEPDGDALTAVLLSTPTHGALTLNDDGSFGYVHDGNDPAPLDAFVYEACDPQGACTGASVTITIDPLLPTASCLLPTQVHEAGDTVLLDLSYLFEPPQGQALSYSIDGLPLSLSVNSGTGLLSGTLAASDANGSPYLAEFIAVTVPGGGAASQYVNFVVLPANELLLRNGFDGPTAPPCQ